MPILVYNRHSGMVAHSLTRPAGLPMSLAQSLTTWFALCVIPSRVLCLFCLSWCPPPIVCLPSRSCLPLSQALCQSARCACLPACWLCWVEWRVPCNFARLGRKAGRRARLAYVIVRGVYKYVQPADCGKSQQFYVSARKSVGAVCHSGGALRHCGQVGLLGCGAFVPHVGRIGRCG